jgi:hypothetical protein
MMLLKLVTMLAAETTMVFSRQDSLMLLAVVAAGS